MTLALLHDINIQSPQDQTLKSATLDESVLTFWRFTYFKTTAFALEPQVYSSTSGTVAFATSSSSTYTKFQMPRGADLAWVTYARIHIPGIVGLNVVAGVHTVLRGMLVEPYWTQAIGQFVLQEVDFLIGNTVIDTLYNWQMFMWEEVSGKPGKRLSEMIGKFDTVVMRQAQSRRSRYLYVPIPFYFTENSGCALPLTSLQFHSVEFQVKFATLASCIVRPSGFPATANVYYRTDGATDAEIEAAPLGSLVGNSDLHCEFISWGVWLDEDERSMFAHGQFEQIVTENQASQVTTPSFSVTAATATESTPAYKHQTRIMFNHVVTEYIFAVRRKAHVDANEHFNFGGFQDTAVTGSPLDPVKEANIEFNTNERVQKFEGKFFRLVVPHVAHTSIPREFIYVWSYAVEPEDAQPSGGVNHSRIDNVYLNLWLDQRIFIDSSTADILTWGRSLNLIRFKSGLAAVRFSS